MAYPKPNPVIIPPKPGGKKTKKPKKKPNKPTPAKPNTCGF